MLTGTLTRSMGNFGFITTGIAACHGSGRVCGRSRGRGRGYGRGRGHSRGWKRARRSTLAKCRAGFVTYLLLSSNYLMGAHGTVHLGKFAVWRGNKSGVKYLLYKKVTRSNPCV